MIVGLITRRSEMFPSFLPKQKRNHPDGWFLFWLRRWDLKGPLASHSRRVSLGTLAPSAPCFGSFASEKHHTVMFFLAHPLPPPPRAGEGFKSPPKRKKQRTPNWCPCFLVAEVGFEPHDLRVMSPTSYQAALLRDMMFR